MQCVNKDPSLEDVAGNVVAQTLTETQREVEFLTNGCCMLRGDVNGCTCSAYFLQFVSESESVLTIVGRHEQRGRFWHQARF